MNMTNCLEDSIRSGVDKRHSPNCVVKQASAWNGCYHGESTIFRGNSQCQLEVPDHDSIKSINMSPPLEM